MAEVTALRNNVLPWPVYGLPYVVTFPILDADGDLVTGAAGLDSEISLNGDTPADCTNEATEIGSSGTYYLILTATEMTTNIATICVKTSTSGAKTTTLTLYPRIYPKFQTGLTAVGGDSAYITLEASSYPDLNDINVGMIVSITAGTGSGQVRFITDFTYSNGRASVTPAFATAPSSDSVYDIYLTDIKSNTFLQWCANAALAAVSAALPAYISRTTYTVATDAGNTGQSFKTTLPSGCSDDAFVNSILKVINGDLTYEAQLITAFNPTTKIVTLKNALSATPADGVGFNIING